MPESRKRPGHTYQKPADIPAKQRVKGTVMWAILFTVFGIIIAYFAVGLDYKILALAGFLSGVIGYFIGRSMERRAK